MRNEGEKKQMKEWMEERSFTIFFALYNAFAAQEDEDEHESDKAEESIEQPGPRTTHPIIATLPVLYAFF